MVQLPDATNFVQPPSTRRHVESPKLWIAAIAGSIGAHLLLLAFTVPLLVKVSAPASGSAPTPIELVELAAAGASPEDLAGESSQDNNGAIAIPNTTIPNTTQLSPEQSSSTEFNPATDQTDQTNALPNPSSEFPQPSTGDYPVGGTASNRRGTVDEDSSQDTPPNPPTSSESGDSPNGDSSGDSPGNPSGANQNSPSPSEQTTPAQPPTNPGDSQPTPENGAEGSDLPGVSISQNVVPTSFTASVAYSTVPLSENPRDIPEQNAVPSVQSQTIISDPIQSTCTVTPDIIRYLGQPVSMQVEIDAEGRVSQTFLREPLPQSQEYAELAACLVKNWEFNPAMSGGQPIYSDNLIVSITISQ